MNIMKIVLKDRDGESFSINISRDDTFGDLKRRVQMESGILLDMKNIHGLQGQVIDEKLKVCDFFALTSSSSSPPSPTHAQNFVQACVVPGCQNTKQRNPDKSFFFFPEEDLRAHQWALYCQRLCADPGRRFKIDELSTICSDHFRKDQFIKNSTSLLKRTAVPCICPELPRDATHIRRADTLVRKHQSTSRTRDGEFTLQRETQLCRLCAEPANSYIFIYDEVGVELQLEHKINTCLPIVIRKTDPLPKQICHDCLRDLHVLYKLHLDAVDNDAQLRQSCNKDTISPEGDEDELPCPLCHTGLMKSVSLDQVSEDEEAPEEIIEAAEVVQEPSEPLETRVDLETIEEETYEVVEDPVSIVAEVDINGASSEPEFSFSCRFCNAECTSHDDLVYHSVEHSEGTGFFCVICQDGFTFQNDLENHVLDHIPEPNSYIASDSEPFHCESCDTVFGDQFLFESHVCKVADPLELSKCKMCSKTFRSLSRLHFHMKFHNGAKPGLCEVCHKVFPDEVKLYKHFVYLHGQEKKYCCETCGRVFRSMSSLKYHKRSHLDDRSAKPFSCDLCGKCFMRKTMLKNHIACCHKNLTMEATMYTCKVCLEAFPSTKAGLAHIEKQHSGEETETSYQLGIETVSKIYKCEFCERNFIYSYDLLQHRESHNTETPYECKYCGAMFDSPSGHTEHKEQLHFVTPAEYEEDTPILPAYMCEYCERSFVSMTKYNEHLTVHYGPQPYHCRFCNAKFPTLQDCREHKASEHADMKNKEFNNFRPYECHYCDKSFAIEDALNKHIRMHTGEKPFICDQCGKGFSQSSGLYTHQKVHSNERPYSCTLCPRTFKIKGDRDVHVRKHSGARPYKCDFCQKAFMTQHVYSQHRKIHTGERPYKCDVCGIAFRRSHVLTVHKRIHTGEKPNVCDICGKRYRQKGDMLKHRRSQHGFV